MLRNLVAAMEDVKRELHDLSLESPPMGSSKDDHSSNGASTAGCDLSASSVSSTSKRSFLDSVPRRDWSIPSSNSPMVPEIPHYEIEKLGLLGSGSFADVYEVKLVHRDVCDELRLDPTKAYAAKMLRRNPSKPDGDGKDRQVQASDLAKEALLLSRLPRHDNVIALLAVSEGFFADPRRGFLLLDRLTETLHDVLERWRMDRKRASAVAKWQLGCRCRALFGVSASEANRAPVASPETLRGAGIGIPLAKAMDFLHRNSIIFRDISPSNIGFDASGTLKLIDFGTARIVSEDREMTKFVGTPRYMSPEVLVGGPYGLPADVYSYAVILWEVSATTLRRPYALVGDVTAAKRSIVEMKYRPPLHQVSDSRVRNLVKSSWDPRPQVRPTFSDIVAELHSIRDSFAVVT